MLPLLLALSLFQPQAEAIAGSAPQLETAAGLVLERMFPELFGERRVPVGLRFNADGVPLVTLMDPGTRELQLLRVVDTGGNGRQAQARVLENATATDLQVQITSASTWDGEKLFSDGVGTIFESLRPEVPLRTGFAFAFDSPWSDLPAQSLLILEQASWGQQQNLGARLLLVAESGRERLRLLSLGESDPALTLSEPRDLVWRRAGDAGALDFRPKDLVLGPEGQPWIVDPGSHGLWRLRPAQSSTQLGPVLAAADEAELLLALRHPNAERRRMAEERMQALRTPLFAQQRALALLEAVTKDEEPLGAASIDRLLALRGAGLPRSEPVLDGGVRERLERHQVRLDELRSEPSAARRLLPRWLDCQARTRLIIAHGLATHVGSTAEERSLGKAALAVPESVSRTLVLLDAPSANVPGEVTAAVLAEQYLDALASLGVEYIEVVHSSEELLPRLAAAHTLVLSAVYGRYSNYWRQLIEAHLARGGGVVVMSTFHGTRDPRESRGELRAQDEWLLDLASMAPRKDGSFLPEGGRASFVRVPKGLERLAEDASVFPCGAYFPIAEAREVSASGASMEMESAALEVLVATPRGQAVIASRNVGPGRVVTFAPALIEASSGAALELNQRLLRALVSYAAEGLTRVTERAVEPGREGSQK